MNILEDGVRVSGQIMADDMAKLRLAGIRSIINNRPDGEMIGQPSHEDIKSAVEAAGFFYKYIPMGGPITPDMISVSIDAYTNLPKPILAYCGSGMRSSALWGFARVQDLGTEDVMKRITDAGYNLEQLRPALESFEKNAQ